MTHSNDVIGRIVDGLVDDLELAQHDVDELLLKDDMQDVFIFRTIPGRERSQGSCYVTSEPLSVWHGYSAVKKAASTAGFDASEYILYALRRLVMNELNIANLTSESRQYAVDGPSTFLVSTPRTWSPRTLR